jgi:uncharacterized membrane protein HdeD (DUF308 family)
MGDHTAARETDTYVVPVSINRLAEHWGLVLAYGLVTLGLGIALVVWPKASVTVFTVLIAIQLIVAGVFRIISALSMSRLDGGARALVGLSGGVALIVGLLVLRDPLQTVVVLGLILGVWWVVAGVIDILGAFISPGSSRRGWDIVSGVISVLAGGFLLVYTDISLHVLVVFAGIWLILAGALATAAAVRLRSDRTAGAR